MFRVLSSYRVPILLAALAACTTSILAAGLNFTVGGTVAGLREVLVLQNNGGDDINVVETGAATLAFKFPGALPAGAIYNVTVKEQPLGQVCSVAKGVGKIASANVTNVQVTCTDINGPRSIGGAVSGLTGPLILQNNGAETLTVNGAGAAPVSFTFPTRVANGARYSVTIRTQPSTPAQSYVVANGTGIAVSDVTNVAVTCSALPIVSLQAEPNVHGATLSWVNPSGVVSSDLYVSSAPNCDIRNYTACPDGALFSSVASPRVVANLRNGQRYFFKLETLFSNGARGLSNEAAATPDVLVFNGEVRAIATAPDGTVYVGGLFTQVRVATATTTVSRNRLAALDATGALLPWNPNADGMVNAIAVTTDWIYVGGAFSGVEGNPGAHPRLAAIRPDGTVNGLGPVVPNGTVHALTVSGNTLYVGGAFTQMGGVDIAHAAAVRASDGALLSDFRPDPNGDVNAIAVHPDSSVYLGGSFSQVRGPGNVRVTLNNVAQVFADVGVVIPTSNSNPTPRFRPNPSGSVSALAISPIIVQGGPAIYIGGSFASIRGPGNNARVDISNLAQVYSDDGVAITNQNGLIFRPNPFPSVRSLIATGSTVYVGGTFDEIVNPVPRRRAFAADAFGSILPWNPQPDDNVLVMALLGNKMYLGGDFSLLGTTHVRGFGTVDALTGAPVP